jgi:ferredoxin/coenzyme F420-reducing hydrogenase delta subunit
MVTIPDSGEKALAKVPFDMARSALESPDGWKIERGNDTIAVTMESLLARVDENLCIACGKCEEACPYKAIRTVFDASGNSHALVELSACRGCGACAGACPTGAISIGHMGDESAFSKIRDAVRESKNNDGIVRFSCMWNKHIHKTDSWPWEVKVQCTRRLSPAMLLETLALGAKGISVLGCEEDECHYLPGPWMGPDVVDSTRGILGAIGIDPRRVAYIDTLDSIEEFMDGISQHGSFKPCADKLPQLKSGIGRSLIAAQVLMAQPDNVWDTEAGTSKTLLAYGCLAMSEPVFVAYGIQDADVLGSAMALLKKAKIEYQMARNIHTTGAGLSEWGVSELHKAYMDSISRELKNSGAGKLVIPTPKSYEAFKAMKPGCDVVSLPGILKGKLSGKFLETLSTVAYHPACSGSSEFDNDCIALLHEVPGLKIIEASEKCGDSGWKNVDSKARDQAKALLAKAEKSGAHILVAGSPRCAAHLRAVTGGWNTSPVKVMDIYTFLASRLGGEE